MDKEDENLNRYIINLIVIINSYIFKVRCNK